MLQKSQEVFSMVWNVFYKFASTTHSIRIGSIRQINDMI